MVVKSKQTYSSRKCAHYQFLETSTVDVHRLGLYQVRVAIDGGSRKHVTCNPLEYPNPRHRSSNLVTHIYTLRVPVEYIESLCLFHEFVLFVLVLSWMRDLACLCT